MYGILYIYRLQFGISAMWNSGFASGNQSVLVCDVRLNAMFDFKAKCHDCMYNHIFKKFIGATRRSKQCHSRHRGFGRISSGTIHFSCCPRNFSANCSIANSYDIASFRLIHRHRCWSIFLLSSVDINASQSPNFAATVRAGRQQMALE